MRASNSERQSRYTPLWIVPIVASAVLPSCQRDAMDSSDFDKQLAASIEAFKNRKIYSRLDPATLASIADKDLELAIVDYVASKLEGQHGNEVEIVRKLVPGARAMYLTWIVDAEVNNGGFNQYYYNTDGKFASEAVAAFEYFGATQHAAVMKDANDVWMSEAAEMARFKTEGTLEAFSESYEYTKLGPLDERYFQLAEDLSRLHISRIRQWPEQFCGQ